MLQDPRIASGIDLDGTMFGSVVREGLHCPFMFVSRDGHNFTNDVSWKRTWRHLTSTKVHLSVADAQHESFTDFPYLAQQLGIEYNSSSPIAGLLGTIKGDEILGITKSVVDDFFRYTLHQSNTTVMDGTLKSFQELSVVRSVEKVYCN